MLFRQDSLHLRLCLCTLINQPARSEIWARQRDPHHSASISRRFCDLMSLLMVATVQSSDRSHCRSVTIIVISLLEYWSWVRMIWFSMSSTSSWITFKCRQIFSICSLTAKSCEFSITWYYKAETTFPIFGLLILSVQHFDQRNGQMD